MAITINQNLQTEWEGYARVPSEVLNQTFLKSAGELIGLKIDRELEDADLSKASVKLALFALALWLYNHRDFMSKLDSDAVQNQVRILLADNQELGRYINE